MCGRDWVKGCDVYPFSEVVCASEGVRCACGAGEKGFPSTSDP